MPAYPYQHPLPEGTPSVTVYPQTPTVGRDVHYVSHGTPIRGDGTQAFPPRCRAAKVTEVAEDGETVGLCVLNPTGQFFHALAAGGSGHVEEGCESTGHTDLPGGTWHWPERI